VYIIGHHLYLWAKLTSNYTPQNEDDNGQFQPFEDAAPINHGVFPLSLIIKLIHLNKLFQKGTTNLLLKVPVFSFALSCPLFFKISIPKTPKYTPLRLTPWKINGWNLQPSPI